MSINLRAATVASLLAIVGVFGPSYGYAATEGKRVALIVGPTQDAFVGTWVKTFEAGAAAKGMKVSTFSSPFDAALQARQIDDAVAQKFDLMVVQTISQKAVIPALTRAKRANIPVMTVIAQFPAGEAKDLFITYVGEESRRLGELAGEAMAQVLSSSGKTKAKIAAVTGAMAEGVAPARMAGFRAALAAKAPGLEIVASEDVKWNPVAGEQAAGQLLARFADQGGLDALYGMNDRLANAIVQAATTASIKLGTGSGGLVVIGGNCQAPGIRNLQDGKMAATVLMLPDVSAQKSVAVSADILGGKKVEPTYYEEHLIINKDNVAQHAQACSY